MTRLKTEENSQNILVENPSSLLMFALAFVPGHRLGTAADFYDIYLSGGILMEYKATAFASIVCIVSIIGLMITRI